MLAVVATQIDDPAVIITDKRMADGWGSRSGIGSGGLPPTCAEMISCFAFD